MAERQVNPTYQVVCPVCAAAVGQQCHSPAGVATSSSHVARVQAAGVAPADVFCPACEAAPGAVCRRGRVPLTYVHNERIRMARLANREARR